MPDTELLESEALVLRDRAAVARVTNSEEYEYAGQELVRVARNIKAIEDAFEQPKRDAFNAHRGITALENRLLELPRAAEKAWRVQIADYRDREERERRLEEARIAAELRREEEDRRIAEAETLASQGHRDEAEHLLSQPVTVPAVRIAAPVAQGISTRKRWTYRITNPANIKRQYLTPDEPKIRKQVNALGPDAAALVGGIEVMQETVVAVRSR